MIELFLLAATPKPDAVSQAGKAVIWYFIGIVIVVPLVKLGIDIYHILKEHGVIGRKNTIPVNQKPENPYEEYNLIKRAYDKLCEDELGIESLTEEEKRALRKHGIDI